MIDATASTKFPLPGAMPVATLALLVVMASSGMNCSQRFRTSSTVVGPSAPQLLAPGVSSAEIIAAVNQNSSRVQSYVANNGSISLPGLPGLPMLQGQIAFERPRRFRLQAGTRVSGAEVDLGSNDQLFWVWSKRNEPPGIYFARHDQFARSNASQSMPIEPTWLIDALGLVTIDPSAGSQTPFPRPDGSWELRTRTLGAGGAVDRVYVIDATRAWVTEQYVYDAAGTLLASAKADRFRYHPEAMVSLPERVTLEAPAAQMRLTINTGQLILNGAVGDPNQLWAMPTLPGVPQVDLGGASPVTALVPPEKPQDRRPVSVPKSLSAAKDPITPASWNSSSATGQVHRLPATGVMLMP